MRDPCGALTQVWEQGGQRRCLNRAALYVPGVGPRCGIHAPKKSCPTCGRPNCRTEGSVRCLFFACHALAWESGWRPVTHRERKLVDRLDLPRRRVPFYFETPERMRYSTWVPDQLREELGRGWAQSVFQWRERDVPFPDSLLRKLTDRLMHHAALRVLAGE